MKIKINKKLIQESVLENIKQEILGNREPGTALLGAGGDSSEQGSGEQPSSNQESGSMSADTNQFMGQKSSDTYMANKQNHEAKASLGL